MGVYWEILYPLSDLNEIWHQSSSKTDRGEFELDRAKCKYNIAENSVALGHDTHNIVLTLSPPNKMSSADLSASIFKMLQCHSKLVKMSECQTTWIQIKSRVTRHLIWIQAVCIWHYNYASRSKG